MPLDKIITDPIISTENAAFSPSGSPIEHLPLVSEVIREPSEHDPLVGAPKTKKPFYRARPLWLVPFALTAAITRGMTLAPRLEVFTELSCRQIHDDYNHTTIPSIQDNHTFIRPLADATAGSSPSYLPSFPQLVKPLEESQGDGHKEGDDPRVIPGKRCISDPAVQAGAAKLQTIMTTTMGTLSALTAGWWGRFGERHGRTRVLAISTLSLFLTDLTFILVSTPHNPLSAHSHKLLILAPIIEGLLGGWSALTSAHTAYIADCTSPGSRATIFARFSGVLSVGLALGPIIGAWLIRNPIPFLKVGKGNHPLQSVNSVFWVAICGTFVNFLLVLLVFPESLPASRRAMNKKGKNRAMRDDDEMDISTVRPCLPIRIVKSIFSPLGEFLPVDVPVVCSAGMPSRTLIRKDWSLTLLALSLFFYSLSSGLFQIKYLYATHTYDWAAEMLSYYVSFMGGVRAFHLLVLLPYLLVAFKPVRAAAAVTSSQANANGVKAKVKLTRSHLFSEIRFDLLVVRCSMFVDFCSQALVVLCPPPSGDAASTWRSQLMFVGATSLASASAGVMPAVQSLALCTLQGRKLAQKEKIVRLQGGIERIPAELDAPPDSGRLFGAVAVLQAITQTILGPIIFGVIYSQTVASFPKAVFAMAGILVLVAIAFTTFLRPDVSLSTPKSNQKTKSKVTPRQRAEERRGRSRVSKDLRGGSAGPALYGAVSYNPSISSAGTGAGTSERAETW